MTVGIVAFHVSAAEVVFGALSIVLFGCGAWFADIVDEFLGILNDVLDAVDFWRVIEALGAVGDEVVFVAHAGLVAIPRSVLAGVGCALALMRRAADAVSRVVLL